MRLTVIKEKKRFNRYIDKIYVVLGFVFMFLIMIISLVPFVWSILSSFKTNSQILTSAFSLPTSFNLTGYKQAIEIADIPQKFFNSIIIASTATIVSLIVYSMAAYGVKKHNSKAMNMVFGLLICSMLVPANAMVQPIFATINKLGLFDTRLALIVVYIAFRMPLCLFIFKSFFYSIPKELEEASQIEGAGYIRTYTTIIVPISKPAFASAGILSFLDSWNELLYALLLTSSDKTRTLPLVMKYFTSMFSFNYTAMFAAMVMCMVPTILVYVVLQEQIMESLVAGSVKG